MKNQNSLNQAISDISAPKQFRFSQLLKICEQFLETIASMEVIIFSKHQVQQVLNALRKLKELEKDKQDEQND